MIKILQVGKYFHPERGGIESVSKSLIDNLDQTKFKMDLLCFNTNSTTIIDKYKHATIIRCGILFSFFSAPFSIGFFKRFFQLHHEYDIIHIHTPNPIALIALYFIHPSAKIIIHWHSDILNKGILYKFIRPFETAALQKASSIIGTSQTYIDESEPLRKYSNKTHFIPLGTTIINRQNQAEGVAALRQQYAGKKIVFSLGRFVGYKGFNYLIAAAAMMQDDIVIIIGGDGPLFQEYELLIQQNKVADKVILTGNISDNHLQNYFEAADIFCLPSCEKSEAFGVVIIEALSFGKPVVATTIEGSGVSWVNQHGVTGLNVPPKNPTALADAINKLANDAALRKQMGDAALERYQHNFTDEIMQNKFESFYHQLIHQ